MELQDKVAIVTGASTGIGKGIALEFARQGAAVVIANSRNRSGAHATVAEIADQGGEATFVQTDVRRRSDVENLVRTTVETYGQLDVLVSNAGIIWFGAFWEHTEADFDALIETNMKGVFLCGQIAARQMVRQGHGGRIINMASIEADVAFSDHAAYAASKGGVAMMTKVMALELAPHGINVNAIAPGVIETPVSAPRMTGDALTETLANIPRGRLGRPADVAHVAVFLASDKADYMTGSVVYVDGGYTSR